MKQIPLTQGKFALVDDEDFGRLSQFNWNATRTWENKFYAVRVVTLRPKRTTTSMHNDVAGTIFVDHRDGDGLNNQRANLRPCTLSQNQGNRTLNRKNFTGFKGVSVVGNKYVATCAGRYLGRYNKSHDAARVYDRAAVAKWGEFAAINFPEDYPHLNLRCIRRLTPSAITDFPAVHAGGAVGGAAWKAQGLVAMGVWGLEDEE